MKISAAVSREGQPHPQIEELDLEEPRVDEVRVRIAATGICHTDIYCHSGRGVPIPRPIVLGHEGAGQVGMRIDGSSPLSQNSERIPSADRLWQQGRFPFDRLVTEFPFQDIGQAWAACTAGKVLKVVLRM